MLGLLPIFICGFIAGGTYAALALCIACIATAQIETLRGRYDLLEKHGLANLDTDVGDFLNYGYWESGDTSPAECSRKLLRKLISLESKALEDADDVLDLGCGKGGALRELAKLTKAKLHGLDVREDHVRLARSLCPDCNIAVGDACSMPYGDESFDVVVCLESAFHYQSKDRFLSEVRRVLRPGGVLLIADIYYSNTCDARGALAQEWFNWLLGVPTRAGRTHSAFNRIAKKNNLATESIDVTDSTFVPFYLAFASAYRPPNLILRAFGAGLCRLLARAQSQWKPFSYKLSVCKKICGHK